MDVRNCKTCGKLYNFISGPPICSQCSKKLEDKFGEVKEYIYNHPGAGMHEVSETFEVSVQQIQKWIREERLSFAEDSLVGIECESCGTNIKTGRFCKACKDKLATNLGNVYKEPEKAKSTHVNVNTSAKMRFLDS